MAEDWNQQSFCLIWFLVSVQSATLFRNWSILRDWWSCETAGLEREAVQNVWVFSLLFPVFSLSSLFFLWVFCSHVPLSPLLLFKAFVSSLFFVPLFVWFLFLPSAYLQSVAQQLLSDFRNSELFRPIERRMALANAFLQKSEAFKLFWLWVRQFFVLSLSLELASSLIALVLFSLLSFFSFFFFLFSASLCTCFSPSVSLSILCVPYFCLSLFFPCCLFLSLVFSSRCRWSEDIVSWKVSERILMKLILLACFLASLFAHPYEPHTILFSWCVFSSSCSFSLSLVCCSQVWMDCWGMHSRTCRIVFFHHLVRFNSSLLLSPSSCVLCFSGCLLLQLIVLFDSKLEEHQLSISLPLYEKSIYTRMQQKQQEYWQAIAHAHSAAEWGRRPFVAGWHTNLKTLVLLYFLVFFLSLLFSSLILSLCRIMRISVSVCVSSRILCVVVLLCFSRWFLPNVLLHLPGYAFSFPQSGPYVCFIPFLVSSTSWWDMTHKEEESIRAFELNRWAGWLAANPLCPFAFLFVLFSLSFPSSVSGMYLTAIWLLTGVDLCIVVLSSFSASSAKPQRLPLIECSLNLQGM